MIQISRFCLSIGVWANGNERVIKKIQGLDEKVMAELMRSIEEVMGTLPENEEEMGEKRVSPIKAPVKLDEWVSGFNVADQADDLEGIEHHPRP